MPCVVTDGVPMRRPLVTNGTARVVGDRVAVERDAGAVEDGLGLLAGELSSKERRSTSMRWLSVPPDTSPEPLAGQRRRERRGVADDLSGVGRERRIGCLAERHRLGRDDVLERPALEAREHRLVDRRAQLGPAEDAAAAWSSQRLVGGEGDDVGVGHRVRVDATGDQPGDVRRVEHEQGPDLVGDLAKRLGLDDAGVGRRPGDDQLRPLGHGHLADLVVVESLVAGRDAVGDEVVEPAAMFTGEPWVRWPPWSRLMPMTLSPGSSSAR